MTRRVLSVLSGFALVSAVAHADDKQPPKPDPDLVVGHVDDDELAKKAPGLGVIVTKKEYAEVMKAWQVKTPPKVDFAKQFLIVATTPGGSIKLRTTVEDDALTVMVLGEADIKPGFWYALKVMDRDGIKTINGKPIPEK